MAEKFKFISATVLMNKAVKRGLSSGRLDIPFTLLSVLFYVYSSPPPAVCAKMLRCCKVIGRSVAPADFNNRLKRLKAKGYVDYNGWGKVTITPSGLNVLSVFNKMLQNEKLPFK